MERHVNPAGSAGRQRAAAILVQAQASRSRECTGERRADTSQRRASSAADCHELRGAGGIDRDASECERRRIDVQISGRGLDELDRADIRLRALRPRVTEEVVIRSD